MVDGKVQVSGQVAVMGINGLMTKVIFDRNPDREFYVEESFPLDWMYPYLEPHGLIMKLNRQPLAQLPAETHRPGSRILAQAGRRHVGRLAGREDDGARDRGVC